MKVMSIAGSDPFSGAGIQADIKTFYRFGVYGFTVITAVTSQNTKEVRDIFEVPPEVVASQIDSVMDDSELCGVKIGMIGHEGSIGVIKEKIENFGLKNIILDPVISSHNGTIFLNESRILKLKKNLIPLSDMITPNIFEAEILSGRKIGDIGDAREAALAISNLGAGSVLIKGGHAIYGKTDLLYVDGEFHYFKNKSMDTLPVHGTGCMLSSAILCGLAKGDTLTDACQVAIDFVQDQIKGAKRIGSDQLIALI